LLVRMAYLMTGVAAEAEEIAQEALARVYERWARVRVMASPGGYACRIALNACRHRLRSRRRFARGPVIVRSEVGSVSPEAETDLRMALDELPISQRAALLLVVWIGMDAVEAGRILGIAPASVRSRVSRARAALRARLEIEGA
jgi:RNA polymerase sigma factor (sigma-70 family)